jgi:hypothetical protein
MPINILKHPKIASIVTIATFSGLTLLSLFWVTIGKKRGQRGWKKRPESPPIISNKVQLTNQ